MSVFGLDKAIGEGVTRGLEKSFGRGGPFEKALDSALAPTFAEMRRLRAYERRHRWHPIEDAPEWLKDGRTVLLACHGDMMFGCWQGPDGDDPGYWDGDPEYGGSPISPQPTHFLILPKLADAAPVRVSSNEQDRSTTGSEATRSGDQRSAPKHLPKHPDTGDGR